MDSITGNIQDKKNCWLVPSYFVNLLSTRFSAVNFGSMNHATLASAGELQ
jgi:hypothetical protein